MQIWAKCSGCFRADSPPRQPGSSVEAIGSGQVVVRRARGHLSLPPTSCVTLGKGTHPSTAQWSDLQNGDINRAYVCVDCTAGYFKAGRFT